MPVSKTAAIGDFQRRVHAMETARTKEIRLSAQEARNLMLEISQLLAQLIDQQDNQEPITVSVKLDKF